jgi:DNA-directed RNA polymerase specialized sigma24 family protein
MPATCAGSITRWIGDLRSGGGAAARHLWERYYGSLVRLARNRLRGRAGAVADEEDAALSALDSFFRRAAAGRFPRLADRRGLRRLLVTMTLRKVVDQIQREHAAIRGGGRRVDEAGLAGRDGSRPGAGLDGFAGREGRPEVAARASEEYRRLWCRLGDDTLRLVLDLSRDGYTKEEIADQIGRSVKTVARKLEVIRTVWMDGEERR